MERTNKVPNAVLARYLLAMGDSVPENQQQLFEVDEPAEPSRRDKKRANYLTPVNPAIILQVWDHYVATFWSGKGRRPQLTDERTKLITAAINQFGIEMVKKAITGCSLSPWHMGQNPTGTLYTSIELILRGAPQVERFYTLTVAEEDAKDF